MVYTASILLPFFFNIFFTPLLIRAAHRFAWYDEQDHRKIHSGDIPRIGGIGIFISFLIGAGLILFLHRADPAVKWENVVEYLPFFLGAWLIHIVGLLDDFANLRARIKLWAQILVAVLVVASGRHFAAVTFPFIDFVLDFGFFGPIITVVWIVGVTNAINLLDGMDGLSSGTSAIAVFFMGLCALYLGNAFGTYLSFFTFGATLGFLYFNFPPAKIFMGDSGSLFLGFTLACIPLYVFPFGDTAHMALPLGITLLLIPILDTLAAILRRRRRGLPIHEPDREHLHHKLLFFGFSNRCILYFVYGKTLILSASAYWWIVARTRLSLSVLFFFWISTIVLFLIIDRVNRRKLEEEDGKAY
jgi:UDP-GlcNAc:undecaprenyl-phosphate/decaprenyl-phosphate GlcNAc-1-phosphate transferase